MIDLQKYLPLDQWVYLKIYTGYRTADRILTDLLYPVWFEAQKLGKTKKWFFVRYSDPDFHLRFRIKLSDRSDGEGIVKRLVEELKPHLDSGLVWDVDISSYFPEIERYGQHSINSVEDIFWADSEAVVAYLAAGETRPESKWLFALASIDKTLEDFKYDLTEKKDLLLQLSRSFGKEFGKNSDLAKQLSGRFRENRKTISVCMEDENPILSQRSVKARKAFGDILSRDDEGCLEVDKNDLVSSIIHMSMNRIFQSHNRMHEMVLYDFLFRYYKSLSFQLKS